ncbi:hypothetical protein B0A48_08329 [Cryoendolithus antarcticus]|uniref:Uncharacterized protein n=1 Tax=Cryoendolithus antarcticus TaxID=1507870 RepID=A0A1V8T556_9PEZI|nr:hypothetical protein B0A48_08329 [Cryoendolithus antarcticus]
MSPWLYRIKTDNRDEMYDTWRGCMRVDEICALKLGEVSDLLSPPDRISSQGRTKNISGVFMKWYRVQQRLEAAGEPIT